MRTDRRRLLRQMLCGHEETSQLGFEELSNADALPPGWVIRKDPDAWRAWAPKACVKCGYVDSIKVFNVAEAAAEWAT